MKWRRKLKMDIDDIDLATVLEPSEVKEKLSKENIKTIDTGISHGTITAIINKKKFEITTLRKDISQMEDMQKLSILANGNKML